MTRPEVSMKAQLQAPFDSDAATTGWIEIDLSQLSENILLFRSYMQEGQILIGSVKANAYGLGVIGISQALVDAGCEMLACGSLSEARQVRRAGNTAPILLFGRPVDNLLPQVAAEGYIPTIHNREHARILSNAANDQPVIAYLKVDAGLGRLGIPIEEAEEAVVEMNSLPGLRIAGLYTHVPFETRGEATLSQKNIDAFAVLVDRLETRGICFDVVQATASSAVLAGLRDPFNAVCAGHALYGIEASAYPLAGPAGFRPVLRALRSRLIQVRAPASSGAAGYGMKARASRLGVVPMGQAEGMTTKGIAAGQHVLVRGRRAAVVSFSFEHTVIDLSHVPNAQAGDLVTFVGEEGPEQITINQFAQWRGTSIKETLAALSERVTYRYYDERRLRQ